MRTIKGALVVCALAVAVTMCRPAMAGSASATIGCGGGNGASTPCTGQGLGGVTFNTNGTVSGSADVAITSTSGLGSLSSLPVFTPNTDQFNFSFSSVGYLFSDGGTFSFTDLTEAGLLSVSGQAEFAETPSLTNVSFIVDATNYTFDGFSGTLNVTGTASLNLAGDPAVTSMTGSVGLPSGGTSTTPEPGTLLLLGSGLSGFAFIRRRFARA